MRNEKEKKRNKKAPDASRTEGSEILIKFPT